MLIESESLQLLDVLHNAEGYIPKRALKFFLNPDQRDETVNLLISELEDVFVYPEEYAQEGSYFLFYTLMLLGHFRAKEAKPILQKVGHLSQDVLGDLLGDCLYDHIPLAVFQMFEDDLDGLKRLIEDPSIDECIRATCIKSLLWYYSHQYMSRDSLVEYLIFLLNQPREKISLFYQMIILVGDLLYPEEMMPLIRPLLEDKDLDLNVLKLSDIEETLNSPKEDILAFAQDHFSTNLDDLIGHFESSSDLTADHFYERNDACPCESGLKYKKCCI